jgi:signal transduction histidine kinase
LRTPLSALDISVSTIKELSAELPDKIAKRIRRIDSELLRLLNLANCFLDVEKQEKGVLSLEITRVAVGTLIERSILAIDGMAQSKSVTIAHESISSDLLIDCDAERIIQVIVNLLSNAIRFSPAGDTVRMVIIDQDFIRFEITDNGPGLTEDDIASLFQAFSTAPGTNVLDPGATPQAAAEDGNATTITQAQSSGAGLGLYICKMLIERHNGTIGATSIPGQSTTFWFTLPKCTPVQ